MKKSKLFSAVLAATISASALVSLSASAVPLDYTSDRSVFDFLNNEEKYIKLDGKYKEFCSLLNFLMFDDEQLAKADIYAVKGRASVFQVVPLNNYKADEIYAVFNLTEGTTEEHVNALLSEKFNLEMAKCNYNTGYRYQIDSRFKEVCKVLKEENLIDSFVIQGEYFGLVEYYINSVDYPLSYRLSYDEYETLKEYVTENNLGDLTLEEGQGHSERLFYTLDIGDSETTEEILDAAIEIYETLDFYPYYVSPAAASDTVQTGSIDVFNAVDGDANCDGELSIADATLILQYLGNADKYSLSAQGEFNADVSGDYDGISAADALTIQMFETGVIDELG